MATTPIDPTLIETPLRPFMKLVQSNVELLSRYAMSPEVASQAMANVQQVLQQMQSSSLNLAQSQAFGDLVQGLMKNYTEFAMEMQQAGMSMLQQAPSAMMKQAQDFAGNVVDVGAERSRRGR